MGSDQVERSVGGQDFFDSQAVARRRRLEVDLGFGLAVVAVPALWALVMVGILGLSWPIALGSALLWASAMLVPAWLALSRQEGGGGLIAQSFGGTPVFPPSADPAAQHLYELVEDMALAAGIPVPDVHLRQQDDSINAMVAGRGTADAALVVTRGAAERLDRARLQALIAHEIDHIQSGDMAVNLRVLGWVTGLSALYDAGAALWRSVSSGFSAAIAQTPWAWRRMAIGLFPLFLPLWLLALLMLGLGSLGKLLGTLLQAAACRHHESSADAAAARMMGDAAPARDLLLMAAGSAAARLGTAPSEPAAEHLWYTSHARRWPRVHPPILDRIRALDPGFDVASFAEAADREWLAGERRRLEVLVPRARREREEAERARAFTETLPYLSLQATPDFVVGKVGRPDWMDIAQGETLRAALPIAVSQSVASPTRARAVVLAILASGDDARWTRQTAMVEHGLGATVRAEVEAERRVVDTLSPYLRLPAVEAAFPGLRRLSRREQRDLIATLKAMELEDGERELFELCLTALVRVGLTDDLRRRAGDGRGVLWHAGDSLRTLLSIVAHHGAPSDPAAREAAYKAGTGSLAGAAAPAFALPPNWAVALDAAFTELADLAPGAKRSVVAAVTATVAQDGRLRLAEAELLRAICGVLRCPLPPLMPEVVAVPSAAPAAPPAT